MSKTEEQIRLLRGCGLNAIDARDIAAWVLAQAGMDSRLVPTINEVLPSFSLSQKDLIRIARTAWYVDAPHKFKRILDPEVETDG